MIHPSKHDDVHYEDADGSMMSTSMIEIGLSTFYDAKYLWHHGMNMTNEEWKMKNDKWCIKY